MTIKKIFTGILLLLALMWLAGELLLKSDERALIKAKATMSATTSEVGGVATSVAKFATPLSAQKKIVTQIPQATSSTKEISKVATSSPVVTLEGKEQMSVTLVLDGKTFAHQLPNGSSVATLLTLAQNKGDLTYVGKEYSGLGMLITAINGKTNNMDKSNLYWIYSVNGKKATRGVSQYVLSFGDMVSWSYEQNTY